MPNTLVSTFNLKFKFETHYGGGACVKIEHVRVFVYVQQTIVD